MRVEYLKREMQEKRIFDVPGQLLVWAADNYPNVKEMFSIGLFSREIFNRIEMQKDAEEIMEKFLEYATNGVGLKPPGEVCGLADRAIWCLSEFIEGDLKHRVNSH